MCIRDRHNGNWGLLVNEEEQSVEIAPIYDCGSCLYPQLDLPHMAEVLNSQEEIDRRIYVFPASAVEEHGVKIPYFDFISSLRCQMCIRDRASISWMDPLKISMN